MSTYLQEHTDRVYPEDPEDLADKPVGDLVGTFARQLTTLVHDEFELAKAEMADKGRQAGVGAGLWGVALGAVLLGAGALTAAAIAALAQVLPVWSSALLVGAGLLTTAGALALLGGRELARAAPPLPSEALEHTKEDVQWLKRHSKPGR